MSTFCDQCQAVSIQGIPCHETGCPNANSIKCESCGEYSRIAYYANNWDGCKHCKDCAARHAEREEEEEGEEK